MPVKTLFKKVISPALFLAAYLPLCSKAQYIGQSDSLMKIKPQIPVKSTSFNLGDIKLLNSRFKENQQRNGKWLLDMDINRLLHSWRVNAGIATYARPLGG